MACLKAAIAMTLGVYASRLFVDCSLFQMVIRSCKIFTDKRVARSLCNSRASCSRWRLSAIWICRMHFGIIYGEFLEIFIIIRNLVEFVR